MSAFNLSMMSSMQSQPNEVSFYFWSCELSSANPSFSWRPEANAASRREDASAAARSERRREAASKEEQQEANSKESKEKKENGEKEEKIEEKEESKSEQKADDSEKKKEENGAEAEDDEDDDDEEEEEEEEEDYDKDFLQHMLQVNGCVLGPQAQGLHLVSVRTRCYRSEPATCPILCIDPAVQRTLTLSHEFLHDSQNEVTFRLEQGNGPLWLTGLHHVHLHDDEHTAEADDGHDAFHELAVTGDEEEIVEITEEEYYQQALKNKKKALQQAEEEEQEEEDDDDDDYDGDDVDQENEDEEEEEEEEEGEEEQEMEEDDDEEDDEIDETSRFRLANQEEADEDEEEDDEGEDKEDVAPKRSKAVTKKRRKNAVANELKPKLTKVAKATKKMQIVRKAKQKAIVGREPIGKRSPLTTAQLRDRKRRREEMN